jgi:cytochrome c
LRFASCGLQVNQIEILLGGKMPKLNLSAAVGAGVLLLVSASAAGAANVDHGKQVFQACAACHSDKPDSLGPSLIGVIGRKAGARDDFRYSNAMAHAGFTWDAGSLKQYLKDPQATACRSPVSPIPRTSTT